jgi:Flp pilus assembly protein TadG
MLLLTLIFGILEFTLAFYTSEFVTYAARAGARYAMVRGSACNSFATNCPATAAQIQTYVKSLTLPGINPALLTMTTTSNVVWPDTSPASTATGCTAASLNTPGCAVQVKLTYTYHLALPWVSTQTVTLTGASEMLISQ